MKSSENAVTLSTCIRARNFVAEVQSFKAAESLGHHQIMGNSREQSYNKSYLERQRFVCWDHTN